MGSAPVIVSLAIVLALQIAIHLRITGIFARVATLKLVTESHTRPENDAFQEALARRLNLILRGIQGYHDQLAEDLRFQVATSETRARVAEGKTADAAPVVAELRALSREMSGVAAELRTLQGDFADLVVATAETQSAQVPPKDAHAPEEPDERKTVEMPPSTTGAPPPASCAPPAPPVTAAPEGVDDEGWDDPEEKTKLFSKDAVPAVLVALRQRAGTPTPRASRHALRPPPIADEGDDDAMERPSILPAARR